jgi:hypothetical protein
MNAITSARHGKTFGDSSSGQALTLLRSRKPVLSPVEGCSRRRGPAGGGLLRPRPQSESVPGGVVPIATLLGSLLCRHFRRRRRVREEAGAQANEKPQTGNRRRETGKSPLLGQALRHSPVFHFRFPVPGFSLSPGRARVPSSVAISGDGGGSGWRPVQHPYDRFQHSVQVVQHLVVRKPQHAAPSLLLQPSRSFGVVLDALDVDIAVDFHHQPSAWAVEVDDERSHWILASKAETGQLTAPQMLPQSMLCRGEGAA